MRILVVGVGGVGGYYGARLAEAGHDVEFIARGANLQALQSNGLEVRSDLGDVRLNHVHAAEDAADLGPVDAVVFCVKTYDNESAAEAAARGIGPDTIVCSFQNGVDNEILLARRFPEATVIAGTTPIVAWLDAPGLVVQQGARVDVTLAAFDVNERSAAAKLGTAFDSAGVPVTLGQDAQAALWFKLAGIASIGSITAYGRCTMGEVLKDDELRRLMGDACREVAAVASARGIELPAGTVDGILTYAEIVLQPDFKSSMARDLEAGRPLEIEAISGAVARYGKEAGVPTPANSAIYDALRREATARRAQASTR
jgi:2-dehydropantoate 2-reductase